MEDHVKRMFDEEWELRAKYEALDSFIGDIVRFRKLPYIDQSLMHGQLRAMGQYLNVLDARLQRAGESNQS